MELHFQEGFSGQLVTVTIDGEERARFTARTRLQIGLAHIEKIDVRPGQEISICIIQLHIGKTFLLEDAFPYATISLTDNNLDIRLSRDLPGYV